MRAKELLAVTSSSIALGLGISACGDRTPNFDTAYAPRDAAALGVINDSGDIGFLFIGRAIKDAHRIVCGNYASREVTIEKSGAVEVSCSLIDDTPNKFRVVTEPN